MSYISQGQMTFLTRHVDKKEWMKPAEKLQKAPIHIGNVSLVVESQLGLEMPGSMHCLIRTGLQGKFLPPTHSARHTSLFQISKCQTDITFQCFRNTGTWRMNQDNLYLIICSNSIIKCCSNFSTSMFVFEFKKKKGFIFEIREEFF